MENKTVIISHIRKTDCAIQTNEEHSRGVADLAEHFSKEIGMSGWGNFLGELHDKGKEKADFQTYIRLMNNMPTDKSRYNDKSHAYVGALLAKKCFPLGYHFVAYALAGHHAGMPDENLLQEQLQKPVPDEVIQDNLPPSPEVPSFFKQLKSENVNHLLRLLYSCLVDADYLDTELFMNKEQANIRGNRTSLTELLPMLETHLQKMGQ